MESPLVLHWHDCLGEGNVPSYASFSQEAIREILPDIWVVRVHYDPLDFEYSLTGDRVRKLISENRTGVRLSTMPTKAKGSKLWATLERVMETQKPVLFHAPYEGPQENIEQVRMDFTPWAGPDGRITRIVAHAWRDALDEAQKKRFQADW